MTRNHPADLIGQRLENCSNKTVVAVSTAVPSAINGPSSLPVQFDDGTFAVLMDWTDIEPVPWRGECGIAAAIRGSVVMPRVKITNELPGFPSSTTVADGGRACIDVFGVDGRIGHIILGFGKLRAERDIWWCDPRPGEHLSEQKTVTVTIRMNTRWRQPDGEEVSGGLFDFALDWTTTEPVNYWSALAEFVRHRLEFNRQAAIQAVSTRWQPLREQRYIPTSYLQQPTIFVNGEEQLCGGDRPNECLSLSPETVA